MSNALSLLKNAKVVTLKDITLKGQLISKGTKGTIVDVDEYDSLSDLEIRFDTGHWGFVDCDTIQLNFETENF